ncbi:efflux RND transporter periplasmic adaptor subunit [bacterium]|nr:efflux RND transporter periplasmic adaptor subunit [bacterium]
MNNKNVIEKAILIFVIAIGTISCGSSDKHEIKNISENKPLKTAHVEQEAAVLEIAATVRAADIAEVASRYGGFVTRIPVKAGTKVQKGELLALMDERTLNAQAEKLGSSREEIRQSILEAKHQYTASESQKELAVSTYERIRQLYEKKSASPQEYQEALSRKNSAEASSEAAAQRVAQAEARLNQISSDEKELAANRSYVRIESPFTGIVSGVYVDPGTFVNPGQNLLTVEKPGAYQISFYVEQELLSMVTEGKKIQVRIPTASNELFDGVVSEVSPSQDPSTRTFLVKADLQNAPKLQSGLSAYVLLESHRASSLWIPEEYLMSKADLETVYVHQDDQWKRVLVKSGNRKSGKVEILSGLSKGEEIGLMENQS